MATLFNDLLRSEGIAPREVRLLRHHTGPGRQDRTIHDLWLRDRADFEAYQAMQAEGRKIFRTARYFASFVCPDPTTTLFVGLYGVELDGTRAVKSPCPYRGDLPGGGAPVDIFRTAPRPELSEHVGKLKIDWPPENVRTWARYAHTAPFVCVGDVPISPNHAALAGDRLGAAIAQRGFAEHHRTKKIVELRRGSLIVYVKREIQRHPLVVHPYYLQHADELAMLAGVSFDLPARTTVNSNLSQFPVYRADHRATDSRHGFALSSTSAGLPGLLAALDRLATIGSDDGPVRAFGTDEEPLTERERLAAARIGQGEFRSRLLELWSGCCPVAEIDDSRLLRASHIKPWSVSTNAERLDPYNGLLLSGTVDLLFDQGLLSFADDGRYLVSPLLSDANVVRLGLNGHARLCGLQPHHLPYLAYHRAQVFKQ
ncbi:MAG TPA: HNH endonuclease [Sphingomonas sp.]|nr:HNH endonuclease [Sphingomonas sp.]